MTDQALESLAARLRATPDLLSMLAASAGQFPERPAVILAGTPDDPSPRSVSYGALVDQAGLVARNLQAGGLQAGDGVAILSPATPEAVAVMVGAAAAGVALPLNPLLSPQAMAAQMRLANTKVAFVAARHPVLDYRERLVAALADTPDVKLVIELPLLQSLEASRWTAIQGVWPQKRGALQARATGSPDRAAALFHTGGTTGEPKLAELSARGVTAGAIMSAAALALVADDRLLVALPLFHVGGAVTSTFAALSVGATVIYCGLLGARDPELVRGVWRALARTQASVLVMVPTSLGAIADVPVAGSDLGRLRGVMTGSSALSPRLAEHIEAKLDRPVCQVFGMTELSGICTAQPLDGRRRRPAVGYPAPMLELTIVPGDGQEASGAVVLGGPNLFLGYRTVSGLEGAPQGGRIDSGDLGFLSEDGQLQLTGRRKDIIIRGGHNIDPLMIEDAAYAYPGVGQAAAVAMPDAYAGELPVLYVSLRPGEDVSVPELEDHLRAHISDPVGRPKLVIVLSSLPLTPVGKVARFVLRQAAAERAAKQFLADLPVRGLSCSDTAAKEITVDWRPDATDAEIEDADARLAALGLRLGSPSRPKA
jgi:fatty-acyl-CoA synthase